MYNCIEFIGERNLLRLRQEGFGICFFPNCLISLMYTPFQCYRKGLENGKHVLCEFPLALSLKVAKEFFEIAERKSWYQFMVLIVNFADYKFI